MSNQNAARDQRSGSELDALRAEVSSLKAMFADMAQLVLPAQFRNSYCGCGKIACRSITIARPGLGDADQVKLCEDCKAPSGGIVVGNIELGPHERETVRLANRIGCRKPA